MIKERNFSCVALLSALTMSGCASAIVHDHIISARNDPPIVTDYDYGLLEIDGRPINRKMEVFKMHFSPGVSVEPGKHTFKVEISPHRRPLDYVPTQSEFTAPLEDGKSYYVVGDAEHLPYLIEKKVPNKALQPTRGG